MKPLKIGNVTIDCPVVLAPMAGVTDLPFRLLCREMGVGLLSMEMVSAKAILYKNRNTESLMEIAPGRIPLPCSCSAAIRRSWEKLRRRSRTVPLISWISIWDVRCRRSSTIRRALR